MTALDQSPQLDGADRHYLHADEELVRRWLRAQTRAKSRGTFLWSKVGAQFSVGSTSAKQICTRHGFNPYEMVKRHG